MKTSPRAPAAWKRRSRKSARAVADCRLEPPAGVAGAGSPGAVFVSTTRGSILRRSSMRRASSPASSGQVEQSSSARTLRPSSCSSSQRSNNSANRGSSASAIIDHPPGRRRGQRPGVSPARGWTKPSRADGNRRLMVLSAKYRTISASGDPARTIVSRDLMELLDANRNQTGFPVSDSSDFGTTGSTPRCPDELVTGEIDPPLTCHLSNFFHRLGPSAPWLSLGRVERVGTNRRPQ